MQITTTTSNSDSLQRPHHTNVRGGILLPWKFEVFRYVTFAECSVGIADFRVPQSVILQFFISFFLNNFYFLIPSLPTRCLIKLNRQYYLSPTHDRPPTLILNAPIDLQLTSSNNFDSTHMYVIDFRILKGCTL